MSGYVLAIDQGTTSSRAIVFDGKQQIAGMGKMEFTQHFPASGWVEHVPEEIWATCLWACKTALRKAKVEAKDIAAIGITNQRETTIIWDRKTGEPIHNAIVWQDRRASKICDALRKAGKERMVSRKTGLLLDPYFSGPKIKWLLDKVKGARKRAEAGELAFGTVDTYLIWRLTGGKVHATDATNACRTLLYNIETNAWDPELLEMLGVPAALLPEVKDCADDFGIDGREHPRCPDPDPRRCRRPAGGDHRAGLLPAGDDEVDLRHRLLRAAQHRDRAGAIEAPAADDDRLPAQRQDDLRARGRDLHGRRVGAVAARRAWAVRDRRGNRHHGEDVRPGAGRLSRPGLRRARGAVVGCRRARARSTASPATRGAANSRGLRSSR